MSEFSPTRTFTSAQQIKHYTLLVSDVLDGPEVLHEDEISFIEIYLGDSSVEK